MNNSEYIRSKIDRLPCGYVFSYSDVIGELSAKEAVVKALNRMVIADA